MNRQVKCYICHFSAVVCDRCEELLKAIQTIVVTGTILYNVNITQLICIENLM